MAETLSFAETAQRYPVGTQVTFRAGWNYKERTGLLKGTVVEVPSGPHGFPCIRIESSDSVYQVFHHQDFIFLGWAQ